MCNPHLCRRSRGNRRSYRWCGGVGPWCRAPGHPGSSPAWAAGWARTRAPTGTGTAGTGSIRSPTSASANTRNGWLICWVRHAEDIGRYRTLKKETTFLERCTRLFLIFFLRWKKREEYVALKLVFSNFNNRLIKSLPVDTRGVRSETKY